MTTKATDEFPEIDWDFPELLERDPEERMEWYSAIGLDKEGNKYEGTAVFVCEELEKVEEIELLPPNN